MRQIPLPHGLYVTVDDADYDQLCRYRWHTKRGNAGNRYAVRCIQESERHGEKQVGTVYMHRQLMQAPPRVQVDHINHDGLDNRRSNLRFVSSEQNAWNRRGANPNSSTGIRGVSWDKRKRKYRALIAPRGRQVWLGYYDTLAEGAAAAKGAQLAWTAAQREGRK